MLSRIAESLFWIGRYLERADGTARILDVHLQLLLEDLWVDEDTACRSLLAVMGGAADDERPLGRSDVLEILCTDRTRPASIASSLVAARENARRAREIISTDLWECLNTTYGRMPRRVAVQRAHSVLWWVRERMALAAGVAETSSSHDDAWLFYSLGHTVERIDMTARLLATRSLTEASGPSWTTILRSCGALEAYLRSYRGVPTAENAAEFLLLDRLFPRSVMFGVVRGEQYLHELDPSNDRVGTRSDAARVLGQIRAELEFRPVADALEDLPGRMEELQDAVGAVSEAVRTRYFPTSAVPVWIGENA